MANCKICATELPPPLPLGRPRLYCSRACSARSRYVGKPKRTIEGRFREKYDVIDCGHATACWVWRASDAAATYGYFWFDGRMQAAHRVSYELFVGPVPEGLVVDHLCGVRRCVNPEHLEPITQSENRKRGLNSTPGGRASCPLGHPFDAENTYVVAGSGYKMCRRCMRERQRRPGGYIARRREACTCTCCDH